MPTLNVRYDKSAQAAYIQISHDRVARTEEVLEDLAWLDLNADGLVVGVELIGVEDEAHLHEVLAVIERHFDGPMGDLRDNRELLTALG